MKTPITYFGGKQKLADTIIALLPKGKLFVEPFIGGGAVFFSLEPYSSEIINDLDSTISIFYRVLKDDFKSLKKKIDGTLYCRATHKVALCIRNQKHLFSDVHIAWSFFCLSALGFSGTLESFGCYTKGAKAKTFENKKKLFTPELAKRLEGVQIENTDALRLIKLRDTPDTVFYLDPPYIDTAQASYRGYTEEMYTQLLDLLSNLKGHFLLSSFPTNVLDKYIKDYGWFSKEIVQVKSASRNKDGTKKMKIEVLTANYPI